MEHKEITSKLAVVGLALAKEDDAILPALAGFLLNDDRILAYDDIIAVDLPLEIGLNGVVPGHTLMRWLKSCKSKDVEFTDKNNKILFKCGGSRLTLPLDDAKDFPFELDAVKSEEWGSIKVEESFFRGLELCSVIVQDRGLSSWLGGVTFSVGKKIKLYATNSERSSICAYVVSGKYPSKKEDKVQKLIVPTSFCKAVLAMRSVLNVDEAFLSIKKDSMVVISFGDDGDKGKVIGKLILSETQPNVSKKVKEFVEEAKTFVPIQDKFVDMLRRSSTVSGKDGVAELSISDGRLHLKTSASNWVIRDNVKLKAKHPDVAFNLMPALLLKMINECGTICFTERFIVSKASDSFIYMTANRLSTTGEDVE